MKRIHIYFKENLHQCQSHVCHVVAPWGSLPESQYSNYLLLLHSPLF